MNDHRANKSAELLQALTDFHRALIERSRRDYELDIGRALSPSEQLQLLLTNPEFAWLRPLSSLIVTLDDLPGESERANEVWRVVLAHDSPLWQRYSQTLATDSQLAIAYGRLREAYAKTKH